MPEEEWTKPDFTVDDPYWGVTEEYVEAVEESFVPTPDHPDNPVVEYYEENLDLKPPEFVEITITPSQAATYYPVTPPPPNVIVTSTPPSAPAVPATEGLHKPPWLRDLLAGLNWTFMGVNLYIGDAVERAIDLVFDWLTWLDSVANQAIAVAEDAFSYVDNLRISLLTFFSQEIDNIRSEISSWWGELSDWWLAKRAWIHSQIDYATQGLSQLRVSWSNFWTVTWPQWTGEVAGLKANWSNFWTLTFPTLVSFTWLGSWWGSRLTEVDLLISSALRTWFPFYDQLASLWSGIAEFFTDPEEWLYQAADRIIERFW